MSKSQKHYQNQVALPNYSAATTFLGSATFRFTSLLFCGFQFHISCVFLEKNNFFIFYNLNVYISSGRQFSF